MRLILHIGTEKTGTTSLQLFVRAHAAALRERGLLTFDGLGPVSQLMLAAYAVDPGRKARLGDLPLDDPEAMARLRADVERRIDDARGGSRAPWALMSSEHLTSRLRTEAEVARLRDLLAPRFAAVEVMVWLRPQAEMAVSLASTAARHGTRVRGGLLAKVKPSDPYFDFDRMVGLWEGAFGAEAVTCVPYRRGPDPISAVLGRAGVARDDLPPPPRRNEAIGVETMRLVTALADAGAARIPHPVLDRMPVGARLTPSRAQMEEAQARMAASNAALVARRPELQSADLAIPEDWPEAGNLDLLDAPGIDAATVSNLVAAYAAAEAPRAPAPAPAPRCPAPPPLAAPPGLRRRLRALLGR
jgi:hypothetical protein